MLWKQRRTVERDVGPVSDTDLDFTQIWQNTISTLDADGLPARERAFLTLARLAGLLDGTALVKVPNDYTKDVVEQRVRDAVTQALSSQLGEQVQLAVTVDTSLDESHHADDTTGYVEQPLATAPPLHLTLQPGQAPLHGQAPGDNV